MALVLSLVPGKTAIGAAQVGELSLGQRSREDIRDVVSQVVRVPGAHEHGRDRRVRGRKAVGDPRDVGGSWFYVKKCGEYAAPAAGLEQLVSNMRWVRFATFR